MRPVRILGVLTALDDKSDGSALATPANHCSRPDTHYLTASPLKHASSVASATLLWDASWRASVLQRFLGLDSARETFARAGTILASRDPPPMLIKLPSHKIAVLPAIGHQISLKNLCLETRAVETKHDSDATVRWRCPLSAVAYARAFGQNIGVPRGLSRRGRPGAGSRVKQSLQLQVHL
ncbi:hypothetical protein VTN00DRAFT_4204 [Thermoascus crustaceus]|uniref:uncharacterized protein n=1 Tax=Thermoascus crustaceus TaxID=5088 RepID=UPI0037445876